MSPERDSVLSPQTLNLRERAILAFCAEGLSDREISSRIRVSRRDVSMIRSHAAAKLVARISSANPFAIREVMLSRSLNSAGL
jgi:DNA-binding CsgD family transcriptional regulator